MSDRPGAAHLADVFIDGVWRPAEGLVAHRLVDPRTETVYGELASAGTGDVDAAVASARRAFVEFSLTSPAERAAILDEVIAAYRDRANELASAVAAEIGAPRAFASAAQVPAGLGHFVIARRLLDNFEFEVQRRTTIVRYEPIGVCGLITPWNWPLNQTTAKVAAALAAGCTVVLKPSELSPLDAIVLTEVLIDARVPEGVFNLVQGGAMVGRTLASHVDVDLVSITGSTAAGVDVARAAAPTVKRVVQELGGKSAVIVLDDADIPHAVGQAAAAAFQNAGQSCAAGTRILVPRDRIDEAGEAARRSAESISLGDDENPAAIGPVVSRRQFDRVQSLIASGVEQGASLLSGGLGRAPGFERGFYVPPTVFTEVSNDMTVAREEIFGPVVVLIGYDDDDDAVRIANDSPYGLSGYVWSSDHDRALGIARRLRTGTVHVNGAPPDIRAPFGGFKRSGNGREWGTEGVLELLEVKSLLGAAL